MNKKFFKLSGLTLKQISSRGKACIYDSVQVALFVQILSFYKYAQKLQFYIFYFELHEKNTVYKSFDLARVKSFSK